MTYGPLQTRTETVNALGEMGRVNDHLGGYITSDLLGGKVSILSPDMGQWSYEYNAFGELIKQTNANKDYTCVGYDLLVRVTRRINFIEAGSQVLLFGPD